MAFATKQSLNSLAAQVRILEQAVKQAHSSTSVSVKPAKDLVSKVITASTALQSLLDVIAGHHSDCIGTALRQDVVQTTLGSTLHGKVGCIAKAASIVRHATAFAVGDTLAKVRAIATTFSGEVPREDADMVPSVAAAVAERLGAIHVDLPKVAVDMPQAAQPEHDSGNKVLKCDVSGATKPVEQPSRHAGSTPGSHVANLGLAEAISALQTLASQANSSFSEAALAKTHQRGLFDASSAGTYQCGRHLGNSHPLDHSCRICGSPRSPRTHTCTI